MQLRKRKEAPPPTLPTPAPKRATKSAPKKPASTTEKADAAPPAPPTLASATLVDAAPFPLESAPPPATATTETTTTDAERVGEVEESASSAAGTPKEGDVIELKGFGGKVWLEDGSETSFEELVGRASQEGGKGVVVFTYPKASTPGCTKQAILFSLLVPNFSSASHTLYGLSHDSPKSNLAFKTKHTLPFHLICDTEGTLLKALGFGKGAKSAKRGSVVVGVDGRVVGRVEGGPDVTVEAAKRAVGIS